MPGGEDRYAWTLLLGPKHDKDSYTLYQIKELLGAPNRPDSGDGQGTIVTPESPPTRPVVRKMVTRRNQTRETLGTLTPVIRMTIGKVQHVEKFEHLVASVRVEQHQDERFLQKPSVTWVREVMEKLMSDQEENRASARILGTNCLDYEMVRAKTMAYASRKVAEQATADASQRRGRGFEDLPTFDLLEGKEVEE